MSRLIRVDGSPSAPPPSRRGYLVRGPIAPVFVEHGALSPADAMPFEPAGPGEAKAFDALRRSGAIRRAGDGWWLDIVAYQANARARERRMLPWLVIGSVVAALLLTLLYRG